MATDTKEQAAPQVGTPIKRALITGASSGIGEEFARQLAGRGHHLVLVARRKDRLAVIAKEITEGRSAACEVIEADLSTQEGVAKVVARIEQGDIDMLVNNAGFGINVAFGDAPSNASSRRSTSTSAP